ncbi:hypothetical protein [Rufibacter sp. LB8]|uniref:hypothetical protein n=1 Tax=Rufibacter sp. LB8 TaxID=2777781 RepID=UPI00178C65B3|nr:hypothetical protein [Rufibacter sp. LB8]
MKSIIKNTKSMILPFLVASVFLSCKIDSKEPAIQTSKQEVVPSKEAIKIDGTTIKVEALSEEEKKLFKNLIKMEESIVLADSVKRYYRTEEGEPEHFLNQLIYSSEEGLIGEQYISYTLTYTPITYQDEDVTISYNFNAGTALHGSGTITSYSGKIVSTSSHCGTSACGTTLSIDGKQVYEKYEDL